MNKQLFYNLQAWPQAYITDADLATLIPKSSSARYALIHRALKDGTLVHIRRGLFLIPSPNRSKVVDSFELAQTIYGPSFISCESALQYHGWIPEAVFTTTCVSTKRSREFSTPIGVFSYQKVPLKHFLLGVERIEKEKKILFLATPWRAIADLIYLKKKDWSSQQTMCDEMRIFDENAVLTAKTLLGELAKNYPNQRTRKVLKRLLEA